MKRISVHALFGLVAVAVARAATPVLTVRGDEIDEAVAELVASRSFKAPTMVAE